ncbi:Box C/D snoRNA protein 1 [Yarrowia sp. B02]|nr:Box C/D snoRNA protein 1 [Yarrowia sp. B02]
MTCSICQQESKYKCPACSARTCSLACSKQHKVSESCSGLPDPTKYLNREALFTDTSVNRDYRFLKRLERDIVVRKQDGESMPIFKRARYNQNRKDGKDNNVMERNGVKVHKVAQGMGRQKRNNSRWDPSIKQFCWTVEWVNADTQETMTVDKVNPVQSLLECFEKRHDKGGKDEKKNIEKEGVSEESQTEKKNDEHTEVTEEKKDPAPGSFYMKRVKSKNTSPILLEPSKPLSENLRDKSVVEYPTIYYTKEEIVRFRQ